MADDWSLPPLHTITRDQVMDALRALGIDPEPVRSLTIDQRWVEVEVELRTDRGESYKADGEHALARIRLPVVRG